MDRLSFKDITGRTLSDTSTMLSSLPSIFGMFTISEWCLLITAVIAILNFIKNWYIDYQKLKMEKEYHNKRMQSEKLWENLQKLQQ